MTLPWRQIFLRTIGKRNFHISKQASLFYEPPDKEGLAIKSQEEKEWKKWPLKKRLFMEMELFKEGIIEMSNQLKENMSENVRLPLNDHEVDVIWRFTGDPKELNEWVVTTDKDNNAGFSLAQLSFTSNSKGLFHGFLDTKLPFDGSLRTTGFCNLNLIPRSTPFKNKKSFDWEDYTHLVFRVRGDGRVYSVNLHLRQTFDVIMYDTYHYFIWTRGGPYWQYVRIPFSKFLFAYKGRIQCSNDPLPQDRVIAISFTLADKITGPFKFEIDYIGVEYDPSHEEETAYEQYDFDDIKIW